ncbi:MAG: DUF2569 family protein, partial [Methylococcales bacterium]|nr:DUF2569 family protein [Methylococcales bacterium]
AQKIDSENTSNFFTPLLIIIFSIALIMAIGKNRNFILVGLVLVMLGMMLFPPYQLQIKDAVTNMGYASILNPPKQWVHNVAYSASINVPVLMAQWLVAMFVGGVAWFLTKKDIAHIPTNSLADSNPEKYPQQFTVSENEVEKEDQTPPTNLTDQNQLALTGIGGWLLLLIMQMMILGPLFSVIRVLGALSVSELSYPALVTLSAWKDYNCISLFGVVALSFWGGLGLLRGRDISVVNRAKMILWINSPIAALFMLLIIPSVILGESIDTQATTGFLASVLVAYVWTAYLAKSKRVQNTYGSPVIDPKNADTLASSAIISHKVNNDDYIYFSGLILLALVVGVILFNRFNL